MAGKVFVARQTGVVAHDGNPTFIHIGITTVREGHPLLALYPEMFEEQKPTFEYDEPAATPKGDPDAPASKTAARQAGARTR